MVIYLNRLFSFSMKATKAEGQGRFSKFEDIECSKKGNPRAVSNIPTSIVSSEPPWVR